MSELSVYLAQTKELAVYGDTRRGYTPPVSRWGDRVKDLREQKNWTQEQLADAVRQRGGLMDRSRLSTIETGSNPNPELQTLQWIADALEVDIGELFIIPRPEEEAGHVRHSAAEERTRGTGHQILEAIAEVTDGEMPAEDTWRGDVIKALAVLARALRRDDSGALTPPASKTGR